MLAREDQQPLEGGTGHRKGRTVHALGKGLAVVITAAHVGEEQERMTMESPVATQFLVHGGGQGRHPILVSLAVANEQFVFLAADVVNGQAQAFTQAQPAAVNKLEWSAIATQADVSEQVVDLLAGEHGRKGVVIFGANLGKDPPLSVTKQIDQEHLGGGEGLPDALGPPALLELNKEEVVAQLGLAQGRGVTAEVLVDQAQLTVIGMTGPIGVVAQSQKLGEAGHRLVGMLIVDGVDILPSGRANGDWDGGLRLVIAWLG